MTVSVDIDTRVLDGFEGMDLQPEMAQAVFRAATEAGGQIQEEGYAQFVDTTGDLPRSFLPPVFLEERERISAGALSTLPHADIQDRGGTIKAKGSRRDPHLAIPLTPMAKKRWPRDWGKSLHLEVKKSTGKGVLRTRDRVAQYVLKKEVTLDGSRYIQIAAEKVTPKVREIMGDGVGIGIQRNLDEAA